MVMISSVPSWSRKQTSVMKKRNFLAVEWSFPFRFHPEEDHFHATSTFFRHFFNVYRRLTPTENKTIFPSESALLCRYRYVLSVIVPRVDHITRYVHKTILVCFPTELFPVWLFQVDYMPSVCPQHTY